MSEATTRSEPLAPPSGPTLDDAVDEALVGLAAPPRTRLRVLGALLCAISAAALFLAFQLRDDVRYAFASSTPLELGDARVVDLDGIRANQLVHVHATPQMADAVQYVRPLFPGEHVVFPVAGRTGEPLYVQVDGSSVESGDFTGRLIPFDAAGGRYGRVGRYLRDELHAPVSGHTWLLVDGATPHSMWPTGALALFLLALALSDLAFLFQLVRRVPDRR